ncbi:cytidylate kinase-like family protein [Anaeromicropila populeti]|uniref:Cytidylate kinase n=1 Tax=Anaeromicropila populeti TaxID=37658 RepID=A0A1I6HLG6_9FIRM|nr:cytidylate kinase-like family protein [Anaeromicropila populeti]SFR55276.1 Cytidylate kinase [Anaeromicropila populeti]
MNKIITISRQYGSGGRQIGKKTAEIFGIPFYDSEIITQAARESGFAEQAFEKAEEKATNSLLYSITMGMNAYAAHDYGVAGLSVDDRIFLAQSDVIRRVAEEGSCVIVGRCADYILKDKENVVNIFICAGLDFRIQHAVSQYGLSSTKAAESILKYDKRRANYYNYHSTQRWGDVNNYHLSIRSDFGGIDHAVNCIKAFLEVE